MESSLALCHNQVMGLYRDLDENQYESLTRRFAPDGVWHRQGKVLQGRDAMMSALQTRSKTQRIHHLIVNLVADTIDADSCAVRCYMMAVRHDDGKPIEGPAPFPGFESIRTVYVDLACIDGRWLIKQMRGDGPTFARV